MSVSKLCGDFEAEFLKLRNQREVVCNITINKISSLELLWEPDFCTNGPSAESVCKKLLWVSTNILLNNY